MAEAGLCDYPYTCMRKAAYLSPSNKQGSEKTAVWGPGRVEAETSNKATAKFQHEATGAAWFRVVDGKPKGLLVTGCGI